MSGAENRADVQRRSAEPVTVVGAGPAGLACAIVLARAGRRVVVREWHGDVGARFHGDFQGIENWSDERDVLDELAAGGIDASFEHHAVSHGIIYDCRGVSYPVNSDRSLYYLVRRGREAGCLDQELRRQAADAGVELIFKSRVREIPGTQGTVVLAIGPRVTDAIAVGYVFETNMADGNWLVLDGRLAPLGYAYLLIHRGRGTVASCMFTGFKRQAEYVAHTVAFFRERTGLDMRNPQPFGGFANFRLPRTAIQGGHPVIGEQAGFQDALAGFGMRYALRSGLLAARSILDGTDYTRLWRRDLLPLLRTGIVNRFIFNLVGERGRSAAAKILSRGDSRAVLRRFYQPSAWSRVMFPIAWLRCHAPLRDRSCDHIDCQCVWCQHRVALKAGSEGTGEPCTIC